MIYVYQKKINDIWYGVAIQKNKVLATYFSVKEPDLIYILRKLPRDFQFQVVEEPTKMLSETLLILDEIFKGQDQEDYVINVEFDHLSSYSKKVFNYTRLIPVGYVTTYNSISKVAGGIARSVGRVEASNPFPLLIPCHRVICSDLSLGGYGYGEQIKRELLQRENRGYQEPKTLKIGDGELSLFPVTLIKKM